MKSIPAARQVPSSIAGPKVGDAATNPPLKDYAIIGDCRSAALVSRLGSIDWLCWPRFDSPSVFCGLVDAGKGGSFSVRPLGIVEVTRSYVGDSAVLCTTFHTEDGEFELTDAMPIASPADSRRTLMPEHEIVRVLRCIRGSGVAEVGFHPRTGFASWNDKLTDRGKLGLRVETREGLLTLRADLPLVLSADRHGATGHKLMRAGDAVHLSLSWSADAPVVLPPLGAWTDEVIQRTLQRWADWSALTRCSGRYREAVVRSAIVLRLLSYAPSGAILAAATTSLPETRGEPRNWDYRYCWLRDAAFTVRGLLALGHADEAIGFANWLLHATRLTQPRLKVLYDVFGRSPAPERQLRHLAGYQGHAPVQTGNGADSQVQLDAYGEVVDAVWRITRAGHRLDRVGRNTLEAFGRYVCAHWSEPDSGIWEPRSGPVLNTHSLVLCWVALDRLIDLQQTGDLRPRYRAVFIEERDRIRQWVESKGFNQQLQSYVSSLEGDELDATALLFGWYGFNPPGSARMKSSCDLLVARLSPQPGLLFRNASAGDDGAFGACCFWWAEHLAQGGGTLQEARAVFEATLSHANDVGIFAELIEPGTGAALGNLPQTFTHVGLINAALSLAEREEREEREERDASNAFDSTLPSEVSA